LRLRRQQLALNGLILREELARLNGSDDVAQLRALIQRMTDHNDEVDAYVTALEALATIVRAMP
jgi:hypothetical protein